MTKINICTFGHYNKLAIKEFVDYLSIILVKFNIKTETNKFIKRDSINFIFEGHHGNHRKSILRILNNSKNIKKGIFITEVIYGSKFLKKKYYTFNNKTLNKFHKSKLFCFIYLLFLNAFYNFSYYFIKNYFWDYYQSRKNEKKIINKLTLSFLKFFLNSFDHPNGNFYWKERYNYFLKISQKTDFTVNISSFDEDYYNNIFKNYFKIEFLSTDKKVYINNDLEKKIDCLFTGQITEYRSKIFKELQKENINIKFYDYLNDDKRKELYKSSKIYLCLKKFKNENLPIGTRAWYCLENSYFFITEETNFKNYLNEFCIEIKSDNLINEIKKILNNYKHYKEIMIKKINNYKSKPFYKNLEIIRFIDFLNKEY